GGDAAARLTRAKVPPAAATSLRWMAGVLDDDKPAHVPDPDDVDSPAPVNGDGAAGSPAPAARAGGAPAPAPPSTPPPKQRRRRLRRTWPQRLLMGGNVIVVMACLATAFGLWYGYDHIAGQIKRVNISHEANVESVLPTARDSNGNIVAVNPSD